MFKHLFKADIAHADLDAAGAVLTASTLKKRRARKYNQNHDPHTGRFSSNPLSASALRDLRALRHGQHPDDKDLPPGVHVVNRGPTWETEGMSFRKLLGLRVQKFNPNHDAAGRFATAQVVAALKAGKPVNVPNPQLPDILHTTAGDAESHPNLMHLSVDGKPIFSEGNLGIRREDMPQVPEKFQSKFLRELPAHVELVHVDPAQLKPTQNELDAFKVGSIYKAIGEGKASNKPILISKDNYVLDGHHHWGGKRAHRVHDHTVTVPAYRVHMTQKELLHAAQSFTDANGIEREDITKEEIGQSIARALKYNPNHSPANGQFTSGAGGSSAQDAEAKRLALHALAVQQKTTQIDRSPEALYAKAQEAHSEMETLLNKGHGIASQLGYKTMQVAPEHANLDAKGGMLFIAPLKNRATAEAKVQAEYGGDWSKLMDVTRATIAVDSVKDLHNVVDKLKASGVKLAREPKNRFEKPSNGYRDVLLNVEFSNGHVGELQLHVKSLLKAKSGEGHRSYEVQRSISHKYPKGTPVHEYSETDREAYRNEVEFQHRLYTDAWRQTPL